MNKIAFNNTINGSSINIKTNNVGSLFNPSETSKIFIKFKIDLVNFLKKDITTNCDILDFAIKEGFLPKHAKENILEFYQAKKILVLDENFKEINDTRKWNIADELKKTTYFKWIENEKN